MLTYVGKEDLMEMDKSAGLLLAVLTLTYLIPLPNTQVKTEEPPVLDQTAAVSYLEKQMAFSKRPEDADMDELSARLAWVLRGSILPDEVRRRTILRAKNMKSDMVGPWGFRQDTAPSKRALALAIIGLDDALRAKQAEKPNP